MQHEDIPAGPAAPVEVNTIVEVPKGSSNKYKYAPRYQHLPLRPHAVLAPALPLRLRLDLRDEGTRASASR